jgi:hypothetical protein
MGKAVPRSRTRTPICRVVWLKGIGLVTLAGIGKKFVVNRYRGKFPAGSALALPFLWPA